MRLADRLGAGHLLDADAGRADIVDADLRQRTPGRARTLARERRRASRQRSRAPARLEGLERVAERAVGAVGRAARPRCSGHGSIRSRSTTAPVRRRRTRCRAATGTVDIVNAVLVGAVEHEEHPVVGDRWSLRSRRPCDRSSLSSATTTSQASSSPTADRRLASARRTAPTPGSRRPAQREPASGAGGAVVAGVADVVGTIVTTSSHAAPTTTADASTLAAAAGGELRRPAASRGCGLLRARSLGSVEAVSALVGQRSAAWYVSSLDGNVPARTSAANCVDRRRSRRRRSSA